MSAEKAIFAMLKAHAPLIAVVPSSRIFPSVIPLNTTLPAIAYSLISEVEETAIGLTALKRRARIQVTIAVSGTSSTAYGSAKSIRALVEAACNHKRCTFNGVAVDSCIKDVVGPDLRDDEASITYQSVDFRIAY